MSTPVPLMTGTTLSRDPKIPASGGNPTSYVQVDGKSNKSFVPPDGKSYKLFVLHDWEPWPDLGPAGRGSEIFLN